MSWDGLLNPDPQPAQDPTWGDYGKAAGTGATAVGAGAAGLLRQLYSVGASGHGADLWKEVQGISRQAGEDLENSMTDEGRSRFEAAVTSEKFWEHPISSTLLKGAGMAPYIVAGALPGAVMSSAAASVAATAAAGGLLSAGDVTEEVTSGIDKASDQSLKEQSALYRGLRADMGEREAREEFSRQILGMKPAIAFALGVGSGLYGPAGNIVRKIQEGSTKEGAALAAKQGLLKGAGLEGQHGVKAAALEGLGTETAEETYGAVAAQQAEKERGARDKYDASEIAARGLTGGAMGALFGGVSGIGGGKHKGAIHEDVDQGTDTGAGENSAAVQTPTTSAQAGTEISTAATAAQTKAAKQGVEVVQPNSPNMAEAAAIADSQQQAKPKIEPIEPPVPPSQVQQPTPPAPPQQMVNPSVPPTEAGVAAPTQQTQVAPPQAASQVAAPTAQQALDGPIQAPAVAAPPPSSPSLPPTDVSARARTPVTSEVTSELQQDRSPPETPAVATPASQPAVAEPSAETAAREAAPQKPRVLRNVSSEAELRAKEQAAAQKANEKAASKPSKAEREPGSKKLSPAERESQAGRATKAEQLFEKHHEPLEMPEKPEARRQMALKIQSVLDDAKAQGLQLREDLPENIRNHFSPPAGYKSPGITEAERHQYHESIPTKVGGKDMSPHVRYLRELVGIQKALMSQKFGPKSKERLRVQQFIVEHNAKDLESLSARRKEEGDEAKRVYQGDVDQAKGAKAKISTPTTAGAASEGVKLGDNAKAQAAAEAMERLAKKEQGAAAAKTEFEREVIPDSNTKDAAPEQVAKAPAAEKPVEPVSKGKAKALSIKEKADAAEARASKAKPEPKALPPKAQAIVEKSKTKEGVTEKEWTALTKSLADESKDPADVKRIKAVVQEQLAAEAKAETKPETKPEQPEKVTPEVTEPPKVASEGTVQKTKLDLIREAAEDKAQAAALQARMKASQERAAKAKPKATPEQIKAALAAMKVQKEKSETEPAPKIYKMTDQEALNELELQTRLDIPKNQTRLEKDEHDIWDTPLHKAQAIYGHTDSSISREGTTKEFLDNLNLDHLAELPKYLQEFTRRRLAELVGDVKIYVADGTLMNDTTGDKKAPGGYYHPKAAAGGKDYIVINANLVGKPKQFAHAVIHEALHAALYNRLRTNAEFRGRIERMMAHLDAETKGTEHAKTAAYSLKDADEFVSEALSNPKLQEVMANMALTPEQVRSFGLPFAPRPMSLWGAFISKVRQMLNLPPGAHNFLHEAFNVIGPELGKARSAQVVAGAKAGKPLSVDMAALRAGASERLQDTGINLGGKLARAKNAMSSAFQMARRNEGYFGPSNPLNRLFDQRSKQEAEKDKILRKYGGADADVAIAKAEREFPEAMAKAKAVLFDASMHDINLDGSNDHLGKDKLMGIQAKNEVARLQKAWADPDINPVRATLQAAVKFYRDIHNAVSHETLKNILGEANIHDAALVDRLHKGGLDESDETWMDNKLVSALSEINSFKRREGSYVPFRRYGEFISAAEHELSVPANATKISDNTLQFVDPTGKGGNARARAAVKGYLRQQAHTPQGNKLVPAQIKKVWVDQNNPTKIIEAEDADAIAAYRVSMQTQHTEFHEHEADAVRNQQTLADAGLLNSRTHTREKAYSNERNLQGAMGTILRSLEKQQRYIDADSTQKAAMREMFADLSKGLSGTTSIKSSMKHRRNVAGMSHDLGRVTADYARMTANHLAKLKYRPEIDKIFAEMRAYMKSHEDKDSIRREEVYNEFSDRIYGDSAKAAEEHKPGVMTRILQMTRLSRLAGPSFHLINAHEPWTTSLPVIGGRHGFAQAARNLVDSYNLIGGRAGVMSGLSDTARAYTSDSGFTDYVKLFKDAIGVSKTLGSDKASRLQSMIDYMADRNLYANSAIFEVGRHADAESNLAGRALDRADLMANQVGSAIEAINRTVTGLTAYNLEYKKNGGNHEAAMHYAYTTAHETMGDYSSWNAAPAFNSPMGRAALQFKKFGHKTYYLLGNIMGKALQGDPEAMKQFAGLMVTHGLVAGVLGLPTEPFKVALMAANAVGVTGFTPDDYDYAVRQLAARLAGQKGGEIISRGLYRGIGIEVSGRMGLDTLLTHGQPKSQKANDLKSFLFDTLAGAPAGYLLDQVAAAQALAKGDVATAIEKSSPIRTVGDVAKAVSGAMGDKKSPAGTTTQEKFNAWETGVRALGFTPSSASELGAMRGTVARESMRISGERTELMNAWAGASGGNKVKAQRDVQTWNAAHQPDQQISQRDLSNAAQRRETEKQTVKHGVKVNRRNKDTYTRAESVFNP